MNEPKMAPGQEPYTPEEYEKLQRLVSDAAEDDPGEDNEDAVTTPPVQRPLFKASELDGIPMYLPCQEDYPDTLPVATVQEQRRLVQGYVVIRFAHGEEPTYAAFKGGWTTEFKEARVFEDRDGGISPLDVVDIHRIQDRNLYGAIAIAAINGLCEAPDMSEVASQLSATDRRDPKQYVIDTPPGIPHTPIYPDSFYAAPRGPYNSGPSQQKRMKAKAQKAKMKKHRKRNR